MPVLLKLTNEPGDVKTQNADGSASYTINYTAQFDADVESGYVADTLAGFYKGLQLSFAPSLTLQNWSTIQTTNLKVWKFNCTFISSTYEAGSSVNSIGIETFSWSETREKTLLNTVGDPILPSIQDTEYWPGIKVIYNDVNLDMSLYNIGGAVNDVALVVAGISVPKYCMKAGALEFKKVSDGVTDTWQMILPLYLCFKKAEGTGTGYTPGDIIGFQKEVINNGFVFADGSAIPNTDGTERTSPAFLNEAGDAVVTDLANAWSILAEPTELNDFSDFNLPTSAPS
jgi:hypothetical protein